MGDVSQGRWSRRDGPGRAEDSLDAVGRDRAEKDVIKALPDGAEHGGAGQEIEGDDGVEEETHCRAKVTVEETVSTA